MPFESEYQEATEPAMIDSLTALVERDMKPALDLFYADDQLPKFAVVTDGDINVFKYPFLVLGVQRVVSKESTQIDEGGLLDQVLIVGAAIAVQSSVSLKDVRALARKYIRAFKAVIRSASVADLFPETARDLNRTIDIDHRYLRHKSKSTEFVQEVEIELRFTFGES